MAPLPTGTVTFLFTDIEGSTTRWEHQFDAMQAALARHDAILRGTIEAHGGHVFKTVGDAFYAVFASAPDALRAAIAAQQAVSAERWSADLGSLRVRMALHSGTPERRDGDYFGPPLNRVARLLSTGHGGQTLLSAATQELVRDQLPAGVELRDMGEHRLKDLIRPERVFQLLAPGLPTAFPPLKTLDYRPNNLPFQPTAFIGRERELEAVRGRLLQPDVRLLTLTGPGGTGKTRIALQVVVDLLDTFADGVWFVDLAPLNDPALVASTIAVTFGVRETGRQPLFESLKIYLREKHLLLLLDNFEQVITAAPLVADLLAAAPGLKVLITSRVALHLRGEREYATPPLPLPDRTSLPSLERLSQYDAVRLFIDRARDVNSAFSITNANAPAVAEICHRLDGLPLAIELAAARVKLLGPEGILQRLDHSLKLLTGGARDTHERHQTLRATIDWSYNLLDAQEHKVFRRLAVFAGGWTLEAAESIYGRAGEIEGDVLDVMQSLVDKSLVRHAPQAQGEPRFSMLETIHEYAMERLNLSGESAEIQARHAAYFRSRAEVAEPRLEGSEQETWLRRLDDDQGNFRAALAWSMDAHGQRDEGLALAGALVRYWHVRGYWREGAVWVKRLLDDGVQDSTTVRAKALLAAAVLEMLLYDLTSARFRVQQSLALYKQDDDAAGIANCLRVAAGIALRSTDARSSSLLYKQSLALYRKLGNRAGQALVLYGLGNVAWIKGDYALACERFNESLRLRRALDDKHGVALAINNLGCISLVQGDLHTARSLLEKSVELLRELDDRPMLAGSLNNLAGIALEQGKYERAREYAEKALAVWRAIVDASDPELCGCYGNLAESVLNLGDTAHALDLVEKALEPAFEFRNEDARATLQLTLSYIHFAGGQLEQARHACEESLRFFRKLGDPVTSARAMIALARVARNQDDTHYAFTLTTQACRLFSDAGVVLSFAPCFEQRAAAFAAINGPVDERRARLLRAVRLWARAAALREAMSTPIPAFERGDYQQALSAARSRLDESSFKTAWSEGQAMTLEHAIAYALEPTSISG